MAGFTGGDVYLLPLSDDAAAAGPPGRLTFEGQNAGGLTWAPDGREVIVSSGSATSRTLRRFPIERFPPAGPQDAPKGEPIPLPGDTADSPAVSRTRRVLAYAKGSFDANIWRTELTPGMAVAGSRPFISSTRRDFNARFSADGAQIVFISERSGHTEVWKCRADGSNPEQLTYLNAHTTGCPRWSPDAARIVFDSNAEGQYEVYVISAKGGALRRLTSHPADDAVASWSRDGQSIYFMSNRTGRPQVWKMTASGENPVQMTQDGGYVSFESYDGRYLYYSRGRGVSALYRMLAGGGPETKVLEAVESFGYDPARNGIYFLGPAEPRGNALQFLDHTTGQVRLLMRLRGTQTEGLTVSPDNRTILHAQYDAAESDLMLVENFR